MHKFHRGEKTVVRSACQTRKLAFASKRVARQQARMLERRYGREFKAYRCPQCGEWHLATSKS